MVYALQYLKRFSGRKIAVLGDMLELFDEIPENIWMKIKTVLNDNDYVNEEVMKVRKLDDEIRLREKPLPPLPEETEKIKLYEKEHF